MRGVDLAEGLAEELGTSVPAGGVDADDAVDGPALGPDAVDDGRQPARTVMTDEEGDDRG